LWWFSLNSFSKLIIYPSFIFFEAKQLEYLKAGSPLSVQMLPHIPNIMSTGYFYKGKPLFLAKNKYV